MARSSAARAEARFKQLCCLGLGGEAVMPALLAELREFIPSFGSTFFFLDERGTLSNVYDENPEAPPLAQLYVQEFYNRPDREMGAGFGDALSRRLGVQGIEEIVKVEMRTFYRSDLYNLIYRPLAYDGMIRLPCWDHKQPRGGLMLSRSPGEGHFTPEEKRHLAALEPFFTHALRDRHNAEVALVDSGKSGLIIADPTGQVMYASVEGRRLLFFATHPRIDEDIAAQRWVILPQTLVQLCVNLAKVFSGDALASVPAYHHRNVWGGFGFDADWLDGINGTSGLIAITIRHEEPLPLKMMRVVAGLPLTRRQSEVCFLMATGATNDTIAEQLGISKHTVVAHGRWIYEELGVHSRSQLMSRLSN